MSLPRISRRTALTGAGALGIAGMLQHTATPAVALGTGLDLNGWSRVDALCDDFSDPSRSDALWHRGIWYPVSGAGEFRPGNVSCSNGQLHLSARAEPTPAGKNFSFGAVESSIDLPGVRSYVEVEAKLLTSRANVLSAIWLQSSNLDGGPGLLRGANPNPEIDVEESFNYTQMCIATHIWPDSDDAKHVAYGGKNAPTGVADVSQAPHRFGIERRDGKLRYWFDRQLAWEVSAPNPSLWQMSRHLVLSLEGHLGAPVASALPASFDVLGVETYYWRGAYWAPSARFRIIDRASGLALTPGSNGSLSATPVSGSSDQVWQLQETDDFTYTITSSTGARLGLRDGMGQSGVPVVLTSKPAGLDAQGSCQRWHVVHDDDGAFTIRSKFSGLPLRWNGTGLVQGTTTEDPHWVLQFAI